MHCKLFCFIRISGETLRDKLLAHLPNFNPGGVGQRVLLLQQRHPHKANDQRTNSKGSGTISTVS